MQWRWLTVVALVPLQLALAGQLEGQTSVQDRRATLAFGVGNSLGVLGTQVEWYFADRISGFGGLGLTPSQVDEEIGGLTFATGIRGYTGGYRHRAFLELSLSEVAIKTYFWPSHRDDERVYGPGLQAGYQFAAYGGFTVNASVGVGYGLSDNPTGSRFQPLLGLGFGYTWRR